MPIPCFVCNEWPLEVYRTSMGTCTYSSCCSGNICYEFYVYDDGLRIKRIGGHEWSWDDNLDTPAAARVRSEEIFLALREARQTRHAATRQRIDPPRPRWQTHGF